jgi:hypothetical protein
MKQITISNYTDEEIILLKKWSEMAKNYYLLHDKAYIEYQKKNYKLTIPVIILSTLSGTASFTLNTFPENIRSYVPLIIGGINIFVGILQTMTQFLQINEMTAFHKRSSISYQILSRNIITELSLPINERTYTAKDFIIICKKELDKIIEQSPNIPTYISKNLDELIKNDKMSENIFDNIYELHKDKIIDTDNNSLNNYNEINQSIV